MDPAGEFGRRWAWCAAGFVAWALVAFCAGDGVATCAPAPAGAAGPASVVADRSGGHDGVAPLAMPPIVEAEIAEDDVDPTGSSARSWLSPANERIAFEAAAASGQRSRGADSAVLVANAADLSRLCRLLC
ncbi:MAG: hypothetical protein ACKOZU_07930 [Planctomycetaceae bacterium]